MWSKLSFGDKVQIAAALVLGGLALKYPNAGNLMLLAGMVLFLHVIWPHVSAVNRLYAFAGMAAVGSVWLAVYVATGELSKATENPPTITPSDKAPSPIPPISSGPISLSSDSSEECAAYDPSELYISGNAFMGYVTDGKVRKLFGHSVDMRFPYSTITTPFDQFTLLEEFRKHTGACWPTGYLGEPFFGDMLIRWPDKSTGDGNCMDTSKSRITLERDTEKGPMFVLLGGVRSLMLLPGISELFVERSRHSQTLCIAGDLPLKTLASRFLDSRNTRTTGVIVYWK